jgi:hypothetical protein
MTGRIIAIEKMGNQINEWRGMGSPEYGFEPVWIENAPRFEIYTRILPQRILPAQIR